MGVTINTPSWSNPGGDTPPPTDPNIGVPLQDAPWAAFGTQDPVEASQNTFQPNATIYIPHTLKFTTTVADGGVVLPRAAVVDYRSLVLANMVMWIRRRGQTTWLLAYTAWQYDMNQGLVFLFDSSFYALPYGRYECQLQYGVPFTTLDAGPLGNAVGTVEVNYVATNPLRSSKPLVLSKNVPAYPAPPASITHMYDAVVNFSAPLTGVLEIGSQILTLGTTDKATLVALTLAFPVQLQISDGARTELIEYAGPNMGNVQVQRAVANSTQYRFPLGSIVSFVWTDQNVANAVAGAGGPPALVTESGVPTSVASSATSVQLLAANNRRLGATITNNSTQILYIVLSNAAASIGSFTVELAPGDYYETPFGYTGPIQGIWASANGNAQVTEIYS